MLIYWGCVLGCIRMACYFIIIQNFGNVVLDNYMDYGLILLKFHIELNTQLRDSCFVYANLY
jgi:hypothetical protein